MDRQQQNYYDRLEKTSGVATSRNPFTTPSKNQNFARNQYLSEMLDRHEAERGKTKTTLRNDPVAALAPFLSVFLAFALGGLAATIALFLRYKMSGDATPVLTSDLDLLVNIVFAIAIAFLMREILSLSAVKRMGAQFAGILLAIVTMHNVVHAIPEPFAKLFSTEWVNHVQRTTEPGSLQFRGHSYKI